MVNLRVRVDASNLFSGGAVQVASSFLSDLARPENTWAHRHTWFNDSEFLFEASNIVLQNSGVQSKPAWLSVVDRKPRKAILSLPPRSDVRFLVFGPGYAPSRSRQRIAGFADVTSISPLTQARSHSRARARSVLSMRLFGREDHLLVEAPHVSRKLQASYGWNADSLSIVPNVVNSIFDRPLDWRPLDMPAGRSRDILFGYVTRGYPHKNHKLLPKLGRALRQLGVPATFVLTLTDAEMSSLSLGPDDCISNVGPLDVPQLANFYRCCDAVIFPSLSECFSAMPLEAMKMGRPVFASDRDFVRDVCGPAAVYFDPLDAQLAAKAIAASIHDPGQLHNLAEVGRSIIAAWPSSSDRTASYLNAIDQALGVRAA